LSFLVLLGLTGNAEEVTWAFPGLRIHKDNLHNQRAPLNPWCLEPRWTPQEKLKSKTMMDTARKAPRSKINLSHQPVNHHTTTPNIKKKNAAPKRARTCTHMFFRSIRLHTNYKKGHVGFNLKWGVEEKTSLVLNLIYFVSWSCDYEESWFLLLQFCSI